VILWIALPEADVPREAREHWHLLAAMVAIAATRQIVELIVQPSCTPASSTNASKSSGCRPS
jgi:hypothetical protein